MGQTPDAHEAGGHNRIHTIPIEIVLCAPFRRYAGGKDPKFLETLSPPTLSQQPIKIVALCRNRQAFGHLIFHRADQTRRSPAILLQLGSHDSWPNKKSTEISVSGQLEPQVRRLDFTANREVGTCSWRLKRKLIEVLSRCRRSVAQHLEIGANAVVIRDDGVRRYKFALTSLDPLDPSFFRHDRPHCSAVLKFDAGFCRYSRQCARDTSDTFDRIESPNGMNE